MRSPGQDNLNPGTPKLSSGSAGLDPRTSNLGSSRVKVSLDPRTSKLGGSSEGAGDLGSSRSRHAAPGPADSAAPGSSGKRGDPFASGSGTPSDPFASPGKPGDPLYSPTVLSKPSDPFASPGSPGTPSNRFPSPGSPSTPSDPFASPGSSSTPSNRSSSQASPNSPGGPYSSQASPYSRPDSPYSSQGSSYSSQNQGAGPGAPGDTFGGPRAPYPSDSAASYSPGNPYGGASSPYSQQYGGQSSPSSGGGPSAYGGQASQYSGGPSQYGGQASQYGGPGPASPSDGGPSQYGGQASQYGGPASQYGGPASQYGGPGPASPLPDRPVSGAAVASLVLGILGFTFITTIPSVICGIVALSSARRTGQRGKGLAVSGIVLSVLWVIILVVAVIVSSSQSSSSSTSGNGNPSPSPSKSSSNLNVLKLAVGDCFNYPSNTQNVSSVTAISCTQPHTAQVYAQFNLSGSSYPSNITTLAGNGCKDPSRTAVINQTLVNNNMTLNFLYPKELSWFAGNRTVNCAIVSPTDVQTSLLNS